MDRNYLQTLITSKLNRINPQIKSMIKKTGNQNIIGHNIELIDISQNSKSGNFDVSLRFHIEKLPESGARNLPEDKMYDSRKANHTVFIGALIEFKAEGISDKMVAYNTEIRYCELNNVKGSTQFDLKIITGFHFDFDKEASTNHPIFHAQQNDRCCKRLFDEKKCPDFNKFNFINEDKLDKHNKFIRIPTPQMDIFSCILMIFADYIIHPTSIEHRKYFRDFIDNMEKQKISFDYSGFEHLSSNFIEPLLYYWYPDYRKRV